MNKIKLKARDEDNLRLTAELEVEETGELRRAVKVGDVDALLEELESVYEKTDDVSESGKVRDFIDCIEKMGCAMVEIEE